MDKSEVQKIKNKLRMRKYRINLAKDVFKKKELEVKKRTERLAAKELSDQESYLSAIQLKYNIAPHSPLTGQPGLLCSHFGCGKTLSLIEKLAGSFCTSHMTTTRKPYA